MQKTLTFALVGLGFLAIAVAVGLYTQTAYGEAPSGLQASVATTSAATFGPFYAFRLFATSTCAARIITTGDNPIRLTFSDNQAARPTNVFGTLQAASTTVEYDSGIYGCGAWFVTGVGASTTGAVVETR